MIFFKLERSTAPTQAVWIRAIYQENGGVLILVLGQRGVFTLTDQSVGQSPENRSPPLCEDLTRSSTVLRVQDNYQISQNTREMDSSSTTTFITDGVSAIARPQSDPGPPTDLVMEGTTHFSQDSIKTFLEKPLVIAEGTIDGTTTGIIDTVDLPEDALAIDVWNEKVSGFQLLRGTLLVRFVFNATVYMQGRVLIAFVPQAQVAGTIPLLRFVHRCTISQLPHVEVDFAGNKDMTIEIPYISPTTAYDLIEGTGPWGRIYLYMYSPLLFSGGTTSLGWKCYCSFKKGTVELLNPTVPLGGTMLKILRQREKKRTGERKEPLKIFQQMNTSEKEGSKIASPPVSAALRTAATVATSLSAIPALTPFTEPVSWVASLASGVAGALGFSKPSDEGGIIRTNNVVTAAHMMNVDGYDGSVKLALLSSAKIQASPAVLGTSEDDMSFRKLASVYAYVDNFSWTPTDAEGDSLEEFDLCPASFDTTLVDTAVNYLVSPPFGGISQMFKYWRGSIRFRLKAVKTKWHTGRLAICFFPGLIATDNPTIDDASWAHRQIWDISGSNEIEFSCPITYNTPYLQRTVPYGLFKIFIDTPMVVPSGVYAGASILVEACMDHDAEFAIPVPNVVTPIIPSTVTPTTLAIDPIKARRKPELERKDKFPIYQQMSDGITPSVSPMKIEIGGAKVSAPDTEAALRCIGEKVEGFRSLSKRFNRVRKTLAVGMNLCIRQFAISPANSTGAAVQLTDLGLDLYTLLGMMYAYSYGGVRFKTLASAGGANNSTYYYLTNNGTTDPTATYVAGTYTLYFTGIHYTNPVLAFGEVECPAYHKLPLRLNRPSYTSNLEPIDFYSPTMWLRVQSTSNTTSTEMYFRACADDGGFSYFLGFPPYILETSLPSEDPLPENSAIERSKVKEGFLSLRASHLSLPPKGGS